MPTISLFRSIENKHYINRAKDRMNKFCESLRKHAIKIINFKKIKNEITNKRSSGII